MVIFLGSPPREVCGPGPWTGVSRERISKATAKVTTTLENNDLIGRFYTRGRIIRQDELSSVVRHSSRTTEDSSSRRIMRLVPVFTLETNNQTNNECLPKFVQTHNAV